MSFSSPAKKAKPTDTSSREYEVWTLTVLHYENNGYKSSVQYEFDSEVKMRDYVQSHYELDRKWSRKLGENEFYYMEKNPKKLYSHVLVLQKIRKLEKITKVIEEDNMLLL